MPMSHDRSAPSSDDRGRVVFLHSDVGDAHKWAAQQEPLHDRFETVALDLHELGIGPGQFSFVEQVGKLLPTILVGNSFGGRVALEKALAFEDRVHGLVLVDPATGSRHINPCRHPAPRRPARTRLPAAVPAIAAMDPSAADAPDASARDEPPPRVAPLAGGTRYLAAILGRGTALALSRSGSANGTAI
jgi:pimeloyl-ACP methyl ester carboxylesterase